MRLHREFRMDELLLHVMTSPNACKARGLSNGRVYTREGNLVASVTQEGLIRYRAMKK
ncbi:MAG: thioesterase family protein [Desulfuromonadales bacterium]|jgi:acyl-CoA thioesterase-2